MKHWFAKNLGDAMLAYGQLSDLEELFSSAIESPDRSHNRAAFIRHESEGRLHCEVKIYFSPDCSALARALNAQPCAKPSPHGLGMFAGSQDSWRILFPEYTRYDLTDFSRLTS
jgi:hypothetical protein